MNASTPVYLCPEAVRTTKMSVHDGGCCCHAVCHSCFDQATKMQGNHKRKRTNDTNTPGGCCHKLENLAVAYEPYWCIPNTKDGLFTLNWMNRAKGCVGCNKMFVCKVKEDWKCNIVLSADIRKWYKTL